MVGIENGLSQRCRPFDSGHDGRGHDAAHAFGLDRLGQRGVGLVDDQRAHPWAYQRATPTTDDSYPSSASMRSAGPLRAAPATIGDTATICPRRAASASLIPGTASSGAIDTTGLDGQTTMEVAAAMASSTPGAGRADSARRSEPPRRQRRGAGARSTPERPPRGRRPVESGCGQDRRTRVPGARLRPRRGPAAW